VKSVCGTLVPCSRAGAAAGPPDGIPVEISLAVSPVEDGRGRIIGASKVARDIGERKRLEKQLLLVNRDFITGVRTRWRRCRRSSPRRRGAPPADARARHVSRFIP
jgi:hypothetical protein